MPGVTRFDETPDGLEVFAAVEAPEDLFVPPALDPLRGQVRTRSVVDEIVAHLRSRTLRRPLAIRVSIELPAGTQCDGMRERFEAAIRAYADAKALETEEAIRVNRFEGLARLPWGAVVALVILLLVFAVYALLPHALKPMLSVTTPFLTVLIWVAIWIPVEYLLYESWSLKRVRKAYRALGDGVTVVALVSGSPEGTPANARAPD